MMRSPANLVLNAVEVYREHGAEVLGYETKGRIEETVFRRGLSVLDRAELTRYAAERGRVWCDEPEETPLRHSPTRVDVPQELERYAEGVRLEPWVFCEVPCCRVAGPGAVGLVDGDRIVLDTAGSHRDFFFTAIGDFLGEKAFEILLRRFSRPPSVPTLGRSPILPLVPVYRNYYYPWLIEYLPKLRMAAAYEARTGIQPTLLIDSDPPSFMYETLSLLGYGDRCLEWTGLEVHAETLLVIDH